MLSTATNWLKRAMVIALYMPAPTTAAKLLQYWFFVLCRKFKFQYNGLEYEPALTAVLLQSLIQGKVIFENTRREHYYSKSVQSRNTKLQFCSNSVEVTVLKQACGQAIIPSHVQRSLANN